MNVIVRHAITNERWEFEPTGGSTVHEFVAAQGITDGDFSVRDEKARVIDSRQITEFEGQRITIGLAEGWEDGWE